MSPNPEPSPHQDENGPSGSAAPDAELGGAQALANSTSVTSTETVSETALPAETELQEEPGPGWHDGGEPPSSGSGWDSGKPDAPEPPRMSFLDHLEELRRRIIRSLIAIALGFGVCWTYADEIYAGLSLPVTQILTELHMDSQLVYTDPTAPFSLYMRLAMLAGLFVASPYVLAQVWGFIAPGLYPHEKRYAIPFVLLCSGLFIAGGAFAYFVAFPAALRFLLTFAHQFRPMITVNEYFSLAITIILGMALVFELPVLILVLTFLRVLTPGFLFRNSRYAILLIFIVAAAITPTSDVPTMMLFAMPLVALYFFGIGLSSLVMWARRRKQEN